MPNGPTYCECRLCASAHAPAMQNHVVKRDFRCVLHPERNHSQTVADK